MDAIIQNNPLKLKTMSKKYGPEIDLSIACMIAEGKTNKEVAFSLKLNVRVIESRLVIMRKQEGVLSTVQLVAKLIKENRITPTL